MNVIVTYLFFAGGSNHLGTSSFISAEWWIALPIVHDLSDQVFLLGPWPSHSRPLGPDAHSVGRILSKCCPSSFVLVSKARAYRGA